MNFHSLSKEEALKLLEEDPHLLWWAPTTRLYDKQRVHLGIMKVSDFFTNSGVQFFAEVKPEKVNYRGYIEEDSNGNRLLAIPSSLLYEFAVGQEVRVTLEGSE